MEPIAYSEFAGGAMRPVHEDDYGQFVIDDDGIRVDGVWYIPREECDTPFMISDDLVEDF